MDRDAGDRQAQNAMARYMGKGQGGAGAFERVRAITPASPDHHREAQRLFEAFHAKTGRTPAMQERLRAMVTA